MPPKKAKKGDQSDKVAAARASNLKLIEDGGTSVFEYKALQTLQVADLVLCFMFWIVSIPRYSDNRMADAPPNYYNVIAFQIFCSFVACVFCAISIHVLHKSFQTPNWNGVVQCVVMKVVLLFMDFMQFAHDDDSQIRNTLLVILLILHGTQIPALTFMSKKAGIAAKSAKGQKKVPSLMRALARIKTDKPITVYTAEVLEQWLNPSANKKKKVQFSLGSEHFTYLSFFMMFVVFGNFYTEFRKLSGQTDPLKMSLSNIYTRSNLSTYWCQKKLDEPIGDDDTSEKFAFDYESACEVHGVDSAAFEVDKKKSCSVRHLLRECNRTKVQAAKRVRVVLVSVDGLRADYADPANSKNSAWKDVLQEAYAGGFLTYQTIQSILPTKTAPGWTSMLSGTEPEVHGQLGDSSSLEMRFDNVFNRAFLEGFFTGISGTSWVSGIVRSKLPGLGGDATVPPGWKDEKAGDDTQFSGKDGVYEAFVLRRNVAKQAVKTQERLDVTPDNPDLSSSSNLLLPLYDLLFAQFSVLDTAAHQTLLFEGATATIDQDESIYQLALNNVSAAVSDIIKQAKSTDEASGFQTVVVITSSHGVDDKGLNGGVTTKERDVPLIVYSHNGNTPWAENGQLNDKGKENVKLIPAMHEGAECANCPPAYVNDIAPTISMMMGLPIPRQNQGRIIKEALGPIDFSTSPNVVEMHYRDHYAQYRSFVEEFFREYGFSFSSDSFPRIAKSKDTTMDKVTSEDTCATQPEVCDNLEESDTVNARAALFARGITDPSKGLLNAFIERRKRNVQLQIISNYLVGTLMFIIVMGLVVVVLQSTTYADVLKPGPKDTKAMGYAFMCLFWYYAVCLGTYYLFFHTWGYECETTEGMNSRDSWKKCVAWGAHQVHNRSMWTRFQFALLGPGVVMSWLIHRSYKFFYSKPPYTPFTNKEENCKRNVRQAMLFCYSGDSQPSDLALIYLIKLYIMLFSILGGLITLFLMSEFSSIVPFVWRVRNLSVHEEDSIKYWDVRFRIICAVGMSLPIQWANLIVAFQWKSQNINKESYEQLFRLKQEKDIRHVPKNERERAQMAVDPKRAEAEANDNLLLKNLDILDEELGSGPTVGTKATIEDLNKQVEEMKVERELIIQRAKEQLQQAEAEKDLFAKRCQQDILQARAEMDVYKEKERTLTADLIALKADHIENQNKFKAIKERDVAQAHAGKEKLLAKVFQTEAELKRVEAERAQLRNDLAAIAREQNADKVLERATRNLEEQLDQAKATKDQLLSRVETLSNELREAKVEKAQIQKQAEADKATMQKLLKEFETRLGTAESMFDKWKGAQ